MIICPFAPYGLAHGLKTCQICYKLGPDFGERISLKPLDRFSSFKVSWNCLDLWLCNVIVICPFAPYELAHGPKSCQIRQHLSQILQNPYLWNRWMDLCHSKFCGIDWTCSCATSSWSWSFDLDHGFSRSNFENAVSQEWEGRLTCYERDVSR